MELVFNVKEIETKDNLVLANQLELVMVVGLSRKQHSSLRE